MTGLPGNPAGSSGAVKHAKTPQSSIARGSPPQEPRGAQTATRSRS